MGVNSPKSLKLACRGAERHDRGYADGTRETSEQERDGRDSDLAPETRPRAEKTEFRMHQTRMFHALVLRL